MQAQASKPPKDGMGPRGVPDCYYTSRVLNSTGRYVRFVRKLRALEEEQRRGAATALQQARDQLCNDFFVKCDRRSLINTVAQRVDLCLASYEEDVNEKRKRLKELLSQEEEQYIRKFVLQAQEGAAAAWRDKLARLTLLQDKRHRDQLQKYADTPLSKCAHVLPCLVKIRAQEAQEIQLYQMREKQQRHAAERELDAMWHDVTMREADALRARLEVDAMERRRRDEECAHYTRRQLEERRQRRDQERERLKQEALELKEHLEQWERQQAQQKFESEEKGKRIAEDRKKAIKEREETLAQQQREAELIQRSWDSLRGQNEPLDRARELRVKQAERDLDECNRKMAQLKLNLERFRDSSEPLILSEGQRRRDAQDLRRCLNKKAREKAAKETSEAIQQQVREQSSAREQREQQALEHQYQSQVDAQLAQLEEFKRHTEERRHKLHQADLLEQIKYNQLLKERALQEEMEERAKCQQAQRHYQEEIKAMLSRPYYSDHVHPFRRAMDRPAGLRLREKCPCSARDHCASAPAPAPHSLPRGRGTSLPLHHSPDSLTLLSLPHVNTTS